MGYNTRYSLKIYDLIKRIPENKDEIIMELRAACQDAQYAIDGSGGCYDSLKWYDHDKDMAEFSKQYPNLVFELNGIGEDAEDMWVSYYHNGLVQDECAQITFDGFDETKLKKPGD